MKDLSLLEKYRLPKEELRLYGVHGDNGNGCFKVYVNGRSFYVIASNGGGWDHLSIHPKNQKRCPTWEEMCAIKDMFFDPEECVVQYHPPKSDYVNISQFVLHLWKPTDQEMPRPPVEFV